MNYPGKSTMNVFHGPVRLLFPVLFYWNKYCHRIFWKWLSVNDCARGCGCKKIKYWMIVRGTDCR